MGARMRGCVRLYRSSELSLERSTVHKLQLTGSCLLCQLQQRLLLLPYSGRAVVRCSIAIDDCQDCTTGTRVRINNTDWRLPLAYSCGTESPRSDCRDRRAAAAAASVESEARPCERCWRLDTASGHWLGESVAPRCTHLRIGHNR